MGATIYFSSEESTRQLREGESDLVEAVRTAVINKRAGGTGLITGRKAFQRPTKDGIKLMHAVQDVYLAHRGHVA